MKEGSDIRTLKDELINGITDLVTLLVTLMKKNDPLFQRLYGVIKEMFTLMMAIRDNVLQAESEMRQLFYQTFKRIKQIFTCASAKTLSQDEEFTSMMEKIYRRRVQKVSSKTYTHEEIEELIDDANQYCGLIETSDAYTSLKVMISLLKSYNELTYTNISYDLIVQIIALFVGLATTTIPFLDLSGNLYLIMMLKSKYEEELETYENWYLKAGRMLK